MVNKSLKVLRVKNGLTQEQMANKMGWSRQYYAKTESGRSFGTVPFWNKLQKAFGVPDDEMWLLVNDTKE